MLRNTDSMYSLLLITSTYHICWLNVFSKFSKEITVDLFLKILEHVKAVVAINKTPNWAVYFMPCALPYATEEQCVPCSSPPWVIRFRKRGIVKEYIPPPVGYLPALVVFLLTRHHVILSLRYSIHCLMSMSWLKFVWSSMTVFWMQCT